MQLTHILCAAFPSYINVSIYANLYEFMLLPTTANSHKCHVRQFVICVKEVLFVSVWLRFGLVLPSSGSPLQFDWLHTRVLDTKNREKKKILAAERQPQFHVSYLIHMNNAYALCAGKSFQKVQIAGMRRTYMHRRLIKILWRPYGSVVCVGKFITILPKRSRAI